MSWAGVFDENLVVGFILLFVRFAALFINTPIFSHMNIPMNMKAAMAFFFSVVFYSSMPPLTIPLDATSLVFAVLSEILFGLTIGIVLQIAFAIINFAGGIITFVMGFSMATAFDPNSGVSSPIVTQFLSLIALMVLFSLDLHHWILLFVDASLKNVPLGGFLLTNNMATYIISASANMFYVGFLIAFPIVALSWISDTIFGMLMKTMPQFNLLVVGYPIKIAVSLAVLIAILSSIIYMFKVQVFDAFGFLEMFF
ncbi:MAG: flagellar biosynthetic protein FliR [Sulfurimonas sp.]|nr:flagellar biosynthetic protein FliR [Sulfurimonadaceae bacterium]